MVRSLYESLCNMESIYADRAAIRYFDEASAQVVEIPYRRYAADLRRFVAFVRSKTSQPGQRIALRLFERFHMNSIAAQLCEQSLCLRQGKEALRTFGHNCAKSIDCLHLFRRGR